MTLTNTELRKWAQLGMKLEAQSLEETGTSLMTGMSYGRSGKAKADDLRRNPPFCDRQALVDWATVALNEECRTTRIQLAEAQKSGDKRTEKEAARYIASMDRCIDAIIEIKEKEHFTYCSYIRDW